MSRQQTLLVIILLILIIVIITGVVYNRTQQKSINELKTTVLNLKQNPTEIQLANIFSDTTECDECGIGSINESE